MTPTDVKAMTAIVRAILRGKWTDELPDWAPEDAEDDYSKGLHGGAPALRAVQTAEALIVLCDSCRYPLDQKAFLKQCGFTC